LNPFYSLDVLNQANAVLKKENIVELKQIFVSGSLSVIRTEILSLKTKKEYHPLKHSWNVFEGAELDHILDSVGIIPALSAGFKMKHPKAKLYILRDGDYSLLHDDVSEENGTVAFLDISDQWNNNWGGYLGIEQEKFELEPNSILITNLFGQRFFFKRINHHANADKIIIIIKSN